MLYFFLSWMVATWVFSFNHIFLHIYMCVCIYKLCSSIIFHNKKIHLLRIEQSQ